MTGPDISVILPLYNDCKTIPKVLAALGAQRTDRRFEIIVVDDGSTDGGAKLVRPPVRLIRQENRGPAAARNRGAAVAQGTTLMFLDSDCMPPPNWVEQMANAISGRFDAAMGTIAAANDGVVPRLVQLEVEDRYRGMAAADGVDFIAAPACGVRRAIFVGLGGFDERLRVAEDVEFAYRFTEAGYRIAFVANVPVLHEHQATWTEFVRTKYVRAVGRLRVFELYPQKLRRDNWTPVSLKVQFALVALAMLLAIPSLFWIPVAPLIVLGLLAAAIACGWPLVLATARRQSSLIGFLPGLAIGASFVLIRAAIILVAMLWTRVTAA